MSNQQTSRLGFECRNFTPISVNYAQLSLHQYDGNWQPTLRRAVTATAIWELQSFASADVKFAVVESTRAGNYLEVLNPSPFDGSDWVT